MSEYLRLSGIFPLLNELLIALVTESAPLNLKICENNFNNC